MLELRDIDLNLLVVFNELRIEGRVWKVAENLGLSAPAVSNALARLRRLLGDELFLPTPKGMKPTPYASQLSESVTAALGLIHGAVNDKASFDPLTSTRGFRIGMTDIGEIYFLPELVNALKALAPGVSLSTVRNTAVNLADEMESGQVDVALGFLPQLKAGFHQRRLFQQRYVCLFRQGHALDKRRITLKDFLAADHVAIVAAGTGHGVVDEALQRSGVRRRVRLTVPHFVAVGHILLNTDLVATVPERLAQRLVQSSGLVYRPHPATLGEVTVHLFWHAKFHRDPASQWLRGLIVERFAD